MSQNRSREFAQTPHRPACHGCGRPVDLENENILVETTERLRSHNKDGIVWHQDCFNTFLDEGEET
jgi:hypothetical protein